MQSQPAQAAHIDHFGALKRFTAPPGWVLVEHTGKGMTPKIVRTLHAPGDPDVTISAYYRGRPVSEDDARLFSSLLSMKPGTPTEELTPAAIKALMHVLGINTVGDNQYTNQAPIGAYECAVFLVQDARTELLNGRTVLRVAGKFHDQQGAPTNFYEGLFYTATDRPQEIEELYLQAPSEQKFAQHLAEWRLSLNSIEWAG